MSGSSVAGELVVQNGKRRGTRVPLTIPVTLIGTASRCDVQVRGPKVLDVHCLISVTPAGPALRSWDPETTRLNGAPTAAGLLHDGDVLQIGPCQFRFVWMTEEMVALSVAPPQEPVLAIADPNVPDDLWELGQRRAELHQHEAEVAALLDDRQRLLAGLMAELAGHREDVRQSLGKDRAAIAADRAAAKQMREHAERLRKDARQRRVRTKALHVRFLAKWKAKWAVERTAVERERAGIERDRTNLNADAAALVAERERFHFDADAARRRLDDSWQLLVEGQRRLLADRQEAERLQVVQQVALDRQQNELDAESRSLEAHRETHEAHIRELISETVRLDVRAAQLNVVVQQLEEKRAGLELEPKSSYAPVAMDRGTEVNSEATEFLGELVQKERDLSRERGGLIAARSEIERQAANLYDQRCVLAEQAAALAIAREAWQIEEYRTVAELEVLARGLAHREAALDARDRETHTRDLNSQLRNENLRECRKAIDDWQADLADREVSLRFLDSELASKREQLTRWEESLGDVARDWAEDHRREVEALRHELEKWAKDRNAMAKKETQLDRDRLEVLAAARRIAASEVAAERGEPRRARVVRKRWERHFKLLGKELEKRHEALLAKSDEADARTRDLTRQLAMLHAHRAAQSETDRLRTIAHREEEPVPEPEPVILAFASGRMGRPAGTELVVLRAA